MCRRCPSAARTINLTGRAGTRVTALNIFEELVSPSSGHRLPMHQHGPKPSPWQVVAEAIGVCG